MPWMPPSVSTTSAPGRIMRWYVLARMTWAPSASTSLASRCTIAPRVPTGMKRGRELATGRGHHAAAGLPIPGRLDEARTHRPDATGPRPGSALQQHGVAETEKAIVLGDRCLVERSPARTDKAVDEAQQCRLRQVKVREQHVDRLPCVRASNKRLLRPDCSPVAFHDSSERTTVVPIATTRSAASTAATVSSGTRYHSLCITWSSRRSTITGRNVSRPTASSTVAMVMPFARRPRGRPG